LDKTLATNFVPLHEVGFLIFLRRAKAQPCS